MKKTIALLVGLIILLILFFVLHNYEWVTSLCMLLEVIIGYYLSVILDKFHTDGKGYKLLFQSIKYMNKDIRLSFSYLFRIEVDGKYLLVKGNRLTNKYQPIGGVYKYYQEAKPKLESFQYRTDTRMGNNDETDDLRIVIKGKYLMSFLDWFLKMEDREYDPRRELVEELIETSLLPEKFVNNIKYRKIFTHNNGVQFSGYLQCDEYLFADIFELVLSEEQKEMIRIAVNENPEQLCLVDDESILKLCYDGLENNIANNAQWLLEE